VLTDTIKTDNHVAVGRAGSCFGITKLPFNLGGEIMSNYKDFTDDKEKMIDFKLLSKTEFLSSYSYLTEEEYNLTKHKEINNEKD